MIVAVAEYSDKYHDELRNDINRNVRKAVEQYARNIGEKNESNLRLRKI